jgi:predicted transcriptional regulator
MSNELYSKLRKHLDNQPGGLPATRSGAELDILKRFYTEEQARIALKISNIPEPANKIAKKLKLEEKSANDKLAQMAKEGLLFRIKSPEGPLYSQPNFIMGIYEFHVDRIDRDIAEKIDDVYDELIGQYWENKKQSNCASYL